MFVKSSSKWTQITKKLEQILGKKAVIKRKNELLTYECDGLPQYRQRPALVILPQTTEQVAQIVRLCNQYQIPWIARGAGTGLSGGALPVEDCLLIATARMNEIVEIDRENQRITVQPGVINNWVTQAVSGAGFYYAPDPSSQTVCSIGGNVAENAGGVHCLKYGTTTNHVLGLTIVTAEGEIIKVGGKVPEMPGFDLTGLFVGSEGTLGIATEITLKILKTPSKVSVILADFNSIEAAASTVSAIISEGIIPAGMEMMDSFSINAVRDIVDASYYSPTAEAMLLVELDGLEVEVENYQQRVVAICERLGAKKITCASDPQTRAKLW